MSILRLFPQGESASLRWEEAQGAIGYVIEIRDLSGKVIENKRISTNSYLLENIQPGTYEHRVGVINKFGKLEGFSDWVRFQIIKTREPLVNTRNIFTAGINEKEKAITLEGDYFLPEMKLYLKKDNQVIEPKDLKVTPPSKVTAKFLIRDINTPGVYDVVLENPKGKKTTITGGFILGTNKEKADKFAKKQERILNNEVPPDYYSTPYWSTLWRSSLIPGWGQYYIDDANWKFVFYPFLLLIAGDAYYSNYRSYMDSRKKYLQNTRIGYILFLQQNQELFFANYLQTERTFQSAKARYERTRIASGALVLFALYNLIDAFLSARSYSLTVFHSNPGIELGESEWFLSIQSTIREPGDFSYRYLEEYTNLEFRRNF